MRIERLEIENFQGINKLEIEADGYDFDVMGNNATGKTTVANAITWLLFDKALDGAKGFSPKPIGSDGLEVHNLDTSVAAAVSVDGNQTVLKKVFHENWTKKRGSKTKSFTGNVTDCYVNGIPKKREEFQKDLDALCHPEHAGVLINPSAFAADMKWQDRRSVLFEMFGGMTDDEIIACHDDLKELPGYLSIPGNEKNLEVSELQAKAKSERKKLNKLLEEYPVRIDEIEKQRIGQDEVMKKPSLLVELKALSSRHDDLSERIHAIQNGKIQEEQREKVEAIKSEIAQKSQEGFEVYQKAKAAFDSLFDEKSKKADAIDDELMKLRLDLVARDKDIKVLVSQQNYLRESFKKEAGVSTDPDELICPVCGRPFPEEKIEAMRYQAAAQRDKKLKELQTRGRELTPEIEGFNKMREELLIKINQLGAMLTDARNDLDSIRSNKPVYVPFEKTREYENLQGKIDLIKRMSVDESKEALKAELNEEIKKCDEDMGKVNQKIAEIDYDGQLGERVDTLRYKLKETSREFEDSEKKLFLCDRFLEAKAESLTDGVNKHFETVRFKLFDEQINGGLKECCEVMVPGKTGLVPWRMANTAGRINAGLEIIDALSSFWGEEMPVIIDNAESVTRLRGTKAQRIRLIVSDSHNSLAIYGYERNDNDGE